PEEAVVLVREANGRAGRPRLRAAADEKRERRPVQPRSVLQAIVLAVEVDVVLAEEVVNDLELLGEARDSVAGRRELEAVRIVLARQPACAHPEHDAPAGDLVCSRRVPGEQRGMAEGHWRDEGPELELGRPRGEPAEARPGIDDGT